MSDKKMPTKLVLASAAVALLSSLALAAAMSIEAEPVKVTHRNSGPRYDIDAVERTRLTQANNQEQPPAAPMGERPPSSGEERENEGDAMPIGHVAIRRIFLFPVMRPAGDWSSGGGANGEPAEGGPHGDMQPQLPTTLHHNQHEQEEAHGQQAVPSMFAKPFWPFMTPARPSIHHDRPEPSEEHHERPSRPHLFGADEASRSPSERPQDQSPAASSSQQPPLFDPIQMMLDIMNQAITAQMMPNMPTDLNNNNNNKPAVNKDDAPQSGNDNAPAESSDERPQMPGTALAGRPPFGLTPGARNNETREDVVEIEGRKYLRKVVTNKHVGENIVFMTRRLIFVPLNETDVATTDTVATTTTTEGSTTTTTTTTTAAPPVAAAEAETPAKAESVDRVGANKPVPATEPTTEQAAATSEATSTTPAAAPSTPTTTASPAPSEQPASSEPSAESSTTPKATASWVERPQPEASDKASERLVAPQPSGSDKPTEKPVAES